MNSPGPDACIRPRLFPPRLRHGRNSVRRPSSAAIGLRYADGVIGPLDPPLRFRAKLYRIGFLRCVDVPREVSGVLGGEPTIPVAGRAAGVPFRSTLTSRGAGAHRLYVHSRIWRARRIDIGDHLEVELSRDDVSREADTPFDLLRALESRPVARDVYEGATVALRREIARWLAGARRIETRQRRIAAALDDLEARATSATRAKMKSRSSRR